MFLKFNHEEVENFIYVIDQIIASLEEDIAETEKLRDELEGVAKGEAISAHAEYQLQISDYENSVTFYTAVRNDLQEFLEETDDNAKFTRNPFFKYDDELLEELKGIREERDSMSSSIDVDLYGGFTPYGAFNKGNFLHQGTPEEMLIDSNDAKLKDIASEISVSLFNLDKNVEELDRLHSVYFEGISLEDLKKEHDKYDGIAENSAQWHKVGMTVSSVSLIAGGLGYSSSGGAAAGEAAATEGVQGPNPPTTYYKYKDMEVIEVMGPNGKPKIPPGIEVTINGKTYVQNNHLIDLNQVDGKGRTNLDRMKKGIAPLDKNGKSVELHHLNQKNDGSRIEITYGEHKGKYSELHTNKVSEIDRPSFDKERKEYWKEKAKEIEV